MNLHINTFIPYSHSKHHLSSFISYSFILLTLIYISLLIPSTQTADLNDTINCVNNYIDSFQSKMKPQLFRIFKKSFPNTLQTTIQHYNVQLNNQSTYIITGDIQAMWLRDSTNQWLPYLKMNQSCPNIKQLTKGLINTQAQFIMIDPYTNAFKKYQRNSMQRPFYLNDKTQKLILGIPIDLCRHKQFATKSIWQRKWEIDSLASFLRLSYQYSKKYQDLSIINMNFIRALKRILTTLEQQSKDQKYEKQKNINFYTFFRDARQLTGGIIKSSAMTGMIKTGFRPSDDPNQLPFNIPGNAMMVSFLRLVLTQILSKVSEESVYYKYVQQIKKQMSTHAEKIMKGIRNYGIVQRPTSDGGSVYAYEVDGFGKFRLYDDANLPSLLSLPYFGFVSKDDPIYINTRAMILSKKNQFYFEYQKFKGQGSSHTPRDTIWPLALIVQALTTDSNDQIANCLYNLQKGAVRDLMHESFSVRNPNVITREWFAWANSFFGQMIVTLSQTKPQLLK